MAFQRAWIYSINPMLSVTDGWFRLAIRISTFHLERLLTRTGNPVYDALIAAYEPLHNALIDAYNHWKQQGGSQLGQTLDFNNLLLLLRGTKIGKWDVAVQNTFDNKTSQYKTLFPQGRAPFQSGKQTDILSAVKVLGEALTATNQFSPLAKEVTDFYKDLQKAFDSQKQSIGNTSLGSEALEKARVAMCIGQYANLGGIIQANPADGDAICYFFDQLALREGTQVLYTGSSKPQKTKNIVVHTFSPGDELKLENDGNSEEWFYLAAQKDALPGNNPVKVAAGEAKTVEVAGLGDLANRYLMVYNPDPHVKGEWTVEFV